jgi:hypothetical protein
MYPDITISKNMPDFQGHAANDLVIRNHDICIGLGLTQVKDRFSISVRLNRMKVDGSEKQDRPWIAGATIITNQLDLGAAFALINGVTHRLTVGGGFSGTLAECDAVISDGWDELDRTYSTLVPGTYVECRYELTVERIFGLNFAVGRRWSRSLVPGDSFINMSYSGYYITTGVSTYF